LTEKIVINFIKNNIFDRGFQLISLFYKFSLLYSPVKIKKYYVKNNSKTNQIKKIKTGKKFRKLFSSFKRGGMGM